MYQHVLYVPKCRHTHSPQHNVPFIVSEFALGIHGKMLAGGLCDSLSEERLGLPEAGHGQFQPAPTDPPQATAEPLGKIVVLLGKLI